MKHIRVRSKEGTELSKAFRPCTGGCKARLPAQKELSVLPIDGQRKSSMPELFFSFPSLLFFATIFNIADAIKYQIDY